MTDNLDYLPQELKAAFTYMAVSFMVFIHGEGEK